MKDQQVNDHCKGTGASYDHCPIAMRANGLNERIRVIGKVHSQDPAELLSCAKGAAVMFAFVSMRTHETQLALKRAIQSSLLGQNASNLGPSCTDLVPLFIGICQF